MKGVVCLLWRKSFRSFSFFKKKYNNSDPLAVETPRISLEEPEFQNVIARAWQDIGSGLSYRLLRSLYRTYLVVLGSFKLTHEAFLGVWLWLQAPIHRLPVSKKFGRGSWAGVNIYLGVGAGIWYDCMCGVLAFSCANQWINRWSSSQGWRMRGERDQLIDDWYCKPPLLSLKSHPE